MRWAIHTEKAPKPIGPYSQAIKVELAPGVFALFVSGQIPIDPSTGRVVEGGIREQGRQALENVKSIVESADLSLRDVVMVFVFLKDLELFQEFNEVYSEFFKDTPPARTVVEVSRLPKDVLVEVSAIALSSPPH